jgi:hypothetical protein
MTEHRVASSHGLLTIDARGYVMSRDIDNDDPDGSGHLARISRFDLAEWRRYWRKGKPGSFDILDLGYWYRDTITQRILFEPPDEKWRNDVADLLRNRASKKESAVTTYEGGAS